MKIYIFIFAFGFTLLGSTGKEPQVPKEQSVPFLVSEHKYYTFDPAYRVSHVPRNDTGSRGYLLQKSVALLVLRRKVPDILTEVPLRAIDVDVTGEQRPHLQEECMLIGWHFFYTGDKIYPYKKFSLQRNMRFQLLNVVNKEVYCDTLTLKYEKATDDLGHEGRFMKNDVLCLRDGMYGSPMICASGRVSGMLMAPDAQWTNCTGYSVMVHELYNKRNHDFFACTKPLFEPDQQLDWSAIRKPNSNFDNVEEDIQSMYEGVVTDFDTSTEEEN